MWTRTRRRVVEEELTEVVSLNSDEVWKKQQREEMKYEENRLHSLDIGLLDISLAQRLAKAGFYCELGHTQCFSCGLGKPLTFWEEGHDPETVHREESPNCKFITGQSDNVSIERWVNYEQNRLNSFDPWWLYAHQLDVSVAQRLAKVGFYHWGFANTVCFSCGLCKDPTFWQQHDPETVHREERPNCKFITGQSDNVSIERWVKYEQNRLDSFDSLRLDYDLGVSVIQRLVKAGFYCWGVSYTECFSCRLYKHWSFWLEGHDPETVHHRESPNCEFITGQIDNVPIDVRQQHKIKFICQASLSRMPKSDEPLENKIHKRKPLEDKLQHWTKIVTGPSKSQMQPERKKNEIFTKAHQNRPTEQRTGLSEEAQQTKSGSKGPEVIPSTSSPPSVQFTPNGNHATQNVYQNVHQRSADVTRSSSSDVRVEKLTSRRDTKAGTSTTYQEPKKKGVSEPIKVKTRSATSDVNRNKSVTSSKGHQEPFVSRSNRNGAHTDKRENTVVTSSDVSRVKPDTTRLKHCGILCSTVTDSDVLSEEQKSGLAEVLDPPQHPQFSDESVRLSTFRTWEVQSPKSLCKAGFFYTGEKDEVRCFHCDGSLCNWERAHDPFTEHARWYPNCAFIRSVQGSEFGSHDNEDTTTVAVVPATSAVKPTTPVNACAILQSLIRDNKETQQKSQETEIKLQVLMDAISNQQPSGHRPMPLESMNSASQHAISDHRQLEWQQSFQDSSGSSSSLIKRSSQMIYNEHTMMAPPAAPILQEADPMETQHHKILMEVASLVTSGMDVHKLGVYLKRRDSDIWRLANGCQDVQHAAYQILCSFYNSVPNKERWGLLIEALIQLDQKGES